MDRKGQAVFPFSRRPVPVNLFQALRAKMAAQIAKEKDYLHIDEKELDLDFNRLPTEHGFRRCSTPKSNIDGNFSSHGSSGSKSLSSSGEFSVHENNDDKPMLEEIEESVDIAAEPWSIATTFEEIDLSHNVSTNSTIPHFLPDRYDKDDDEEESWDSNDLSDYIRYEYDYYGYLREMEEEYGQYDDYLDGSFWAGLPDPFESLNLLLIIMESAEDNQTDKKAQKRNHRGTRRQQRYRAKAKLLQLCELASAQAAELMEVEEEEDKQMNNSLQMNFSLSIIDYSTRGGECCGEAKKKSS
ncbi:hypothetical protein I4U23_005343 [Adineta vaga]|nr:hypothetical protein I4U23_005343 [Adineta vaga]